MELDQSTSLLPVPLKVLHLDQWKDRRAVPSRDHLQAQLISRLPARSRGRRGARSTYRHRGRLRVHLPVRLMRHRPVPWTYRLSVRSKARLQVQCSCSDSTYYESSLRS